MDLMDYPEEDIAAQLTYYEFSVYVGISVRPVLSLLSSPMQIACQA